MKKITFKEFIIGGEISDKEIDIILEAANWAPTHAKCEPWRYSVLKGDQITCLRKSNLYV